MIWNSKYEGKTFICFTKICIMVNKKYVEKKGKKLVLVLTRTHDRLGPASAC